MGQNQANLGSTTMRWSAGILIVLATAFVSEAQTPKVEKPLADLYPLKVGTKWTYDVDAGNGQKVQVTNQISKLETIDGQSLARMETLVNGNVQTSEHLSATAKGVFRHRANGVECTPAVCILKYPPKEGEKWEETTKIGPQEVKMACVSGPSEEVTTQAGKYKAVSVAVDTTINGVKLESTSWYAPGVGMVKQKVVIGGRTITLELVKFEAGK
ncbi:MAG: hypothetical protein JWN86_3831 [Planctomycetota bacterium]|nr:hypothetical protein [Planctomycetota bacterium]